MARQLTENRDQYVKLFKAFTRQSDYNEVEGAWVKSRLGEYLLKRHAEDHTISILSAGCGDGHKDYGLLEALISRKVDYTAFDASAEMMQDFTKRVVDSKTFPNVNFKLLTITCEDFVERKSRSTYDLICILHVIYSITSIDYYVAKYRSLLSPEGVLVISHVALDSPVMTCRSQQLGLKPYTPDLGGIIKQLGYDHRKERITDHVNISSWFAKESPKHAEEASMSEEAMDLLKFMIYLDILETVSSARISEFKDSMRAASVSDGDKLLLPHVVDIYIIKP